MPRYIDADALLENLKKQYGEELGWQVTVNMSDVGMMIEDAPTANVAPKTEVAREIFEELCGLVMSKTPMIIRPIFKDDWDFDGGFINGKRDAFIEALMIIAELKKKYTNN